MVEEFGFGARPIGQTLPRLPSMQFNLSGPLQSEEGRFLLIEF